jgi:hypothetical protein
MKSEPRITLAKNGNMHIHVPMAIRQQKGRKVIIAPKALDGDVPNTPEVAQNAIVLALARAFAWQEELDSKRIKSVAALAKKLNLDHSYVTRILKLTTLAPDIVEAIINGEEPNGLSLAKLVKGFPENWEEQRKWVGVKI